MKHLAHNKEVASTRAILSVLGSDRPGIVAAVTGCLASHAINILDISQTILQGIFTMTMLVDMEASDVDFATVQDQLSALSTELGVQITLQGEEVFKYMYRL